MEIQARILMLTKSNKNIKEFIQSTLLLHTLTLSLINALSEVNGQSKKKQAKDLFVAKAKRLIW
jgi:hypothetical protein